MQDIELNIFVNDLSKGMQNCTALELGCGTCTNFPIFRDAGISYYGMDGSATALVRDRVQQAVRPSMRARPRVARRER